MPVVILSNNFKWWD